ncbi:MAG: hypothetical protein HRU70_08565 [Phycisphaeraceae bacterium]|nr:MAG: hypothetical protein HRU70_08565 [Phycisphaeraceae bacterium]
MRSIASIAALALVPLCGCSSPATLSDGTAYPRELRQASTLDIQVFRRGRDLELTNTTARSFGPCTVWLNGRYSKRLDGIAVGETLRLELSGFRDEFGEPFKAGGFFAAEIPDIVILCQIEEAPEGSGRVLWGLRVAGPLVDE